MSLPPSTSSPIFNSSFFLGANDYLTISTGDTRYIRIGGVGSFSSLAVAGNLDCGSLTIGGSSGDLSALTGVTAGTVTASKLIQVDGSKNISGFGTLSATTLTGTLSTSAQPNITSLGTITNLTASTNLSGTIGTAAQPNITSTGDLTLPTQLAITSGTLSTAAQANVTSVGTLTSLTTSGLITTSFSNATSSLVSYGTWTNSSVPITCNIQLSNLGVVIGNSTNHPLRLATNNTNRLYINESGQINVGSSNQTTYLFQIPGTCNIQTPYINGTQLTSRATELNVLAGVTAGTVSASKGLVVDSSKNLVGLNSLSLQNNVSAAWSNSSVTSTYGLQMLSTINTATEQLGSGIAFANDSVASNVPYAAITLNRTDATSGNLNVYCRTSTTLKKVAQFAPDKSLVLNGSTSVATLTSIGSSNFTDGNYQRAMTLKSDNPTPLALDFQIDSRDQSLDTTYSAFIGTLSLNSLKFGVNDSTKMTISASSGTVGYIGIGTSTPNTPLDVRGTQSRTFAAPSANYGQLGTTSTTFSIGPVSVGVCATFADSVLLTAGSYYTTSDRRLKTNITELPDTTDFVRNVSPVAFDYKSGSDRRCIGYIAQDVARTSIELINFMDNETLKVEGDGDIEGVQLSVDYTKICCLLHKAMQSILQRLDALEKKRYRLNV
ncbi:TPA: hypothetical protein N0F65_004796 [Lagenidium giganteum]|uniref:Peptidase S74 domain-containing protein n=1 Tax=Lagenidium giganteum TaxID=4803 RepID=A0AAV2Z772_9STRA|nr:TPA: hypothetical protein N0F65_004796 [Lagenidium giganteum]